MTPHKQLLGHHPRLGQYGDCWRTAIACIMDMDPGGVPHFADGGYDDAMERTQEWLKPLGLMMVNIWFPGELTLQQVLDKIDVKLHYLVSGRGPRGRTPANHTVVACDKRIVHDPSPGQPLGLPGPCHDGRWWIHFLARLEEG